MTNEKRQKTRNTYCFYYVGGNSLLPLKIMKFSRSLLFCHCSARAKLFKKKTPNYPACRTNCMQDNISMRLMKPGDLLNRKHRADWANSCP
jgi:hypothetical protein